MILAARHSRRASGGRSLRFVLLALTSAFVVLASSKGIAREVRVTLLHTAEVRGHVEPLRYREWDRHHGGLLRCASLVERIRREEANVVLVDTGGLIQGSAESYLSAGLLPLKAASWMAYDARVPSPEETRPEPLTRSEADRLTPIPLVAADGARTDAPAGSAAYRICRRDGLFIALVGLRAASATDPDAQMAAFDAAMKEVRAERPHVTVVLAHQSYDPAAKPDASLLIRLMKSYPDIDVVLGGGSGRVTRSAKVGHVVYTEAGCEARWLGRVNLVYDTVQRELLACDTEILDVGPDIPIHEPLREGLGSSLGRIQRALDRELGQSTRRLEPTSSTPGQSDTQELLGRALAEALESDIVLGGSVGLGGLAKGPVRYRDILRAIPEQLGAACVEITAAELRYVLEENMDRLEQGDFLGIHGAQYTWAVDGVGVGQVRDLVLADGSRPHGRRRLRVAFDPILLDPGRPGRSLLWETARAPASRLEMLPVDARALVAVYVEKHGIDAIRRSPGFRVRAR